VDEKKRKEDERRRGKERGSVRGVFEMMTSSRKEGGEQTRMQAIPDSHRLLKNGRRRSFALSMRMRIKEISKVCFQNEGQENC
jgi:hypothetical protein